MSMQPTRRAFLGLCGAAALAAIPVRVLSQAAPIKLDIKDPKAFLDGIMKLDRPLDRVLALYACQLPALLDPMLAQLTSDEAKPDDKLLLWASAYQATDKKNLPLAYELAVKARNVAKRDLQSTADQQIILLATLLLAEKDNKVDVSAAKSALLRLSKSIVDPDQKPIAAKKLKQFGLDMAAERIVRPTVVRNRNNSYVRTSFGSGINQKTTQDAATLARKGNRAGAATRIYQQIRQVFQQQQGNQSYYLRQIKEVVSAVKLEKDIANQMRPVATASFRERVEFMRVMCAIDKPENYAAELKALHQENPQDANLLNLMTLIAPSEISPTILAKPMMWTETAPFESAATRVDRRAHV